MLGNWCRQANMSMLIKKYYLDNAGVHQHMWQWSIVQFTFWPYGGALLTSIKWHMNNKYATNMPNPQPRYYFFWDETVKRGAKCDDMMEKVDNACHRASSERGLNHQHAHNVLSMHLQKARLVAIRLKCANEISIVNTSWCPLTNLSSSASMPRQTLHLFAIGIVL